MNCKEIGNVGGQTVRCDLPEGHEGNHHAVVEATREMQLETERDAVTDRLAAVIVERDEAREALNVERAEHGATRRLLGLARAEATEWAKKAASAEHDAGMARAEVAMLRGEGCEEDGDGSCGACLKCAARGLREQNAKDLQIARYGIERRDTEITDLRAKVAEAEAALHGHLVGGCVGVEARWRILGKDEVLLPDDEFQHHGGRWAQVGWQGAGCVIDKPGRHRRRVLDEPAHVEDRSPEQQDAAMAPWRADPPTAEPGEHDANLSEWHARRAPDVLERMRKAGAI